MKRGSCLGWAAVLTAVLCGTQAQAQNLGLGTGSRPSSGDSAEMRSGSGEEGSSPRRSQMNKRLGLTARRVFDPKVFEARGRELQGQFYEIGMPADPKRGLPPRGPAGEANDGSLQRKGRTQWMVWAGVAGLAGASAGAVGYLLMTKAHPTAPPPNIILVKD